LLVLNKQYSFPFISIYFHTFLNFQKISINIEFVARERQGRYPSFSYCIIMISKTETWRFKMLNSKGNRKMKKLPILKQAGFTMFEILIGAVVFTLLASIIVPLITGTKDKVIMTTQELNQMRSTLSNIEDRYYDEFITEDLNNSEVIDGQMVAESYRTLGNTTIYNIFDGEITITGKTNNGLEWISEGITKAACTKFVDDASNLGFETVDVGGTAVQYLGATNKDYTAACVAGLGSDEIVTLTWTRDPS
jgi:type II secretory pathway pseudopilin PulG